MAVKPIEASLPADLPEDWTAGQIVAPDGAPVGLSRQHGYNYLMEQVNRAQRGVNSVNEAFENVIVRDPETGKIPESDLPRVIPDNVVVENPTENGAQLTRNQQLSVLGSAVRWITRLAGGLSASGTAALQHPYPSNTPFSFSKIEYSDSSKLFFPSP